MGALTAPSSRAAQSIAELVATRAFDRGELSGQPRKTIVKLLTEAALLGIETGRNGTIADAKSEIGG